MNKGRILVVEDLDEVRQAVALTLKKEGHHVTQAADGQSAKEKVKSEYGYLFDAVICDLHMHNGGGVELIKWLRSRYPWLRIIVLTGHPEIERPGWFYEVGVFQYLLKPVAPRLLCDVVGLALKGHTVRDEAPIGQEV